MLSAVSPHLKALFASGMADSRQREVRAHPTLST